MNRFWMVVLERNEVRSAIGRWVGGEEDERRVIYDFVSKEEATIFAEKEAIGHSSGLVYVMESVKCSVSKTEVVTVNKSYEWEKDEDEDEKEKEL